MTKRFPPERREPRFERDYDEEERAGRRASPGKPKKSKGRSARRTSILGLLLRWTLVACIWTGVAGTAAVAYYASKLPPIDQLTVPKRPPNIAIMSVDGQLLANRGDTGGAAVHIADLPPYLPKAFVAIEDRRFYSHFGVDPFGILRAVSRNVTGRGTMQGGSTLTQQLAKNLFLTQERTLPRKIQEAILALWLEHRYSKTQILELYLNRVYFGSGAFGVEAASRKYFGHGAKDVTLQEAAMLAGLMKAPSKLAPNRNPDAATERAAQVVAAMKDEGFITDGMAKLALAKPAQAVKETGAGSINYAADYVVDTLDDTIGAIEDDIVVTTTISQPLQAGAEKALTEELDKKGGKFGVTQGAMVAMDPDGSIRVLIGGRDYAASQFDRAVSAKRQPGSSFKPFVYLAALERGLTPDTVREDGPVNVRGWQPENYSHEYFGPVTLTKALSLSLNTVAVRVGLEAGPRTVATTAHRLGITSELQPNASIALGTSEVSPLEMVTAYTPFANGGIGVQPHIITRVKTASGRLLYQRKTGSNGRVIDPRYVAMMNTMMTETLISGTARKGEIPGWQAAGKTGTSQDWRDAWFIGYTSRLVTGVWLGNDDSSPTKKASGGNLPVEIWSRFMKQAMAGEQPEPLPLGTWHGDGPANEASPLFGREPRESPVASAVPPQPQPRDPAAGERAAYGYKAPPRQARRDAGELVPPADIPAEGGDYRRVASPSMFERIFGGG
jgi:penicillin-binding protein 1A